MRTGEPTVKDLLEDIAREREYSNGLIQENNRLSAKIKDLERMNEELTDRNVKLFDVCMKFMGKAVSILEDAADGGA